MSPKAAFSLLSSPRTRGCFHKDVADVCRALLFPAHAGVLLGPLQPREQVMALPRACGGASGGGNDLAELVDSSPRMRG